MRANYKAAINSPTHMITRKRKHFVSEKLCNYHDALKPQRKHLFCLVSPGSTTPDPSMWAVVDHRHLSMFG